MKIEFWCTLAFLMILLPGCGGDKPTEPEGEQMDVTPVEMAAILNSQIGQKFAEDPWDVNNDGQIDIFDLMVVAQHFGEAGEATDGGEQKEGAVLEIVNRQQPDKSIQVTGSGSALGEPDTAVLNLGVSVESASVARARGEAAEAMQNVLDSLKGNGVLEQDIQTQQFSIQPQFDYVNGRQEFRGYRVTNTVAAKVRNLDEIGQIIDDAAEAGGDLVRVESIQFAIDNITELQAQARVNAMRDAHEKARTLAEEGGVTLGKPISISEAGSSSTSPPFSRGDAGEAIPTTPIETGQLQLTVTVNVVYEIQ